uniref:helix-turn-helix domain-containing protein n=1 Tax=uncultured Draconibacterium sp. TaxID=1573823 RepID=UPI003216F8DE
METIGAKILEIRQRKGYTQEKLSDLSRINLRTLQRIEKGTTQPRNDTLKNICQVLEVNIEDILDYGRSENLKFIKYFHLSVLACMFFPLGSVLLPLILWVTKRDKIIGLNEQGLNVLNFQILWSILFYFSFTLWGVFSIAQWSNAYFFLFTGCALYVPNIIYPIIISQKIKKGIMKKFYFTPIEFLK